MRIKVPKALPYRYLDIAVVCGGPVIEKLQGQEILVNPLLIVEVLSPTTEGYDYGQKFTAYQSIESFREYLLVAQDRPHVTHYLRQADGQWLRSDIEGMDGVVKLVTVECELSFEEIYRLVEFSAPSPPKYSQRPSWFLSNSMYSSMVNLCLGAADIAMPPKSFKRSRPSASNDTTFRPPSAPTRCLRLPCFAIRPN
jgi:hypothetical protein